jgi:hypothetical protein
VCKSGKYIDIHIHKYDTQMHTGSQVVDQSAVLKSEAYILFYERRGTVGGAKTSSKHKL